MLEEEQKPSLLHQSQKVQIKVPHFYHFEDSSQAAFAVPGSGLLSGLLRALEVTQKRFRCPDIP